MNRDVLRALQKAVPLVAALALLVVPTTVGFSSGANKDTISDTHFGEMGCTACHGGKAFAPGGTDVISYSILDEDGEPLAGNQYHAEGRYDITITLDEQNEPGAANHAGFNLRVTAGKLEAVEGVSQVTSDGLEATHVNAQSTSWHVVWVAPGEGPAVFSLYVNDVDGSGNPDPADQVYNIGFWVTDEHAAVPGAVSEGHEEFGISLQQYWIGLIGLLGMVLVMVAAFAYLKFANPHNSDAKDR